MIVVSYACNAKSFVYEIGENDQKTSRLVNLTEMLTDNPCKECYTTDVLMMYATVSVRATIPKRITPSKFVPRHLQINSMLKQCQASGVFGHMHTAKAYNLVNLYQNILLSACIIINESGYTLVSAFMMLLRFKGYIYVSKEPT